ncbi:MAG TPA: FAD-dependent thymidylate synthase [Candidatus Kapabacteria bacterium]|jgi:thymidylate synthase (FAD)|nr:FAD-dependent thymidylate synthase [Candidatus Kapabacteria bacterium]HOM04457.1 FAD-dependent thymidylate synthase [Candidatus Kapabacteria bacterium]HOQ49474.1 FAD-dependent thymidylate synthase [Candidatus Kapabacteria bacterium]HPP39100.1 FAD-dependent thymidylate synthase [Candidatus Kapabacteria bacterium]HPU23266.1 FAD-dependent thymidylate synthase [Candidatus Kapabacteria bacterium]
MENKDNLVLEYKCLDYGFVRLVDWMGDDSSIVQAARVSYGKGTKSVSEDTALIRYLMRNLHTSPFEMVEFKFHVKLPIFVARQWIRHRTANVNEYSGRYSEMPDEFYLPEPDQLRLQSTLNKQGRGEATIDNASDVLSRMKQTQERLFQEYSELLATGLAREIARINLPLSNYTEWYWKIDLHNLFHFLRLRLESHAQYEIRIYAEAIAKIIKQIVPIAYKAFEDYILEAIRFSRNELNALKLLINKELPPDEKLAELGLSKREIQEFKEKLSKI